MLGKTPPDAIVTPARSLHRDVVLDHRLTPCGSMACMSNLSNSNISMAVDSLAQLLVISDSQLYVPRVDAGLLVVSGCVAR